MTIFITDNTKEFPAAAYFPEASKKYINKYSVAVNALKANGTPPVPERIEALAKLCCENHHKKDYRRENLDLAFAATECVKLPDAPEYANFDSEYPRLTDSDVNFALAKIPKNEQWIRNVVNRTASRYNLSVTDDLIADAKMLLKFLSQEVSYWEADSLPLDAMMDLKNRYDWTFTSDAWSLREQLKREATVIRNVWTKLLQLAEKTPLLVILNEKTPTDYLTAALPCGVSFFNQNSCEQNSCESDSCEQNSCESDSCESDIYKNEAGILLYTGLKISSSEHRDPIKDTFEGESIKQAMAQAIKLGRCPVLCDFSRRRFSRSFMRVVRFAMQEGWGIKPLGKLLDLDAVKIPEAKSARGFAPMIGSPCLILFDPWPISDSQIISRLHLKMQKTFCHVPQTKPWQDDRIGARTEMEADENGNYRVSSKAWIVPVLGGWMKVDELFKSRLARFLTYPNNLHSEKSVGVV